jgi:hypothetical protein
MCPCPEDLMSKSDKIIPPNMRRINLQFSYDVNEERK